MRFLHANINEDFEPGRDTVPYEGLSLLDRWLLSRLARLIDRVRESYDNYTLHSIYHAVHNFCTVDLSALYLDIVKDRIYVEHRDARKRRASQTVIFETLIALVKLIAPILSSTADEMWSYLKDYVAEESVFLARFPAADKTLINGAIEEKWERIWRIRELANKKIEEKRTAKEIGHSLDTKVIIDAPDEDHTALMELGDELKDVFIVSQFEVRKAAVLDVTVIRAEGDKCERCWQYDTNILRDGRFPNVCKRCADTLSLL